MNTERILKNDLSILIARSNEGKTSFLCSLIMDYKAKYKGEVWVYGMEQELVERLKVKRFSSLIELEQISQSIVIIDEIGTLFDLENKKLRKQVDNILRLVNHNGNKILASGVPTDFKKFLCAKTKCFIFKTLNIGDLINGCLAKEILLQYKGNGTGVFTFQIPISEALCYDGQFWTETFDYCVEYDTKKENTNLFQKRFKNGN